MYFSISQGDRIPVVRTQLNDASGYIDLSNYNVYFIYKGKYQTGVNPTTGLASVVSATSGIAEYAWTANDVATPGIYHCYWLISGTSNNKFSRFPNDCYLRFSISPLL